MKIVFKFTISLFLACPAGTYGQNCSSHCGHCSNRTSCDHVTGQCRQGCLDGYHGDLCQDGLLTFFFLFVCLYITTLDHTIVPFLWLYLALLVFFNCIIYYLRHSMLLSVYSIAFVAFCNSFFFFLKPKQTSRAICRILSSVQLWLFSLAWWSYVCKLPTVSSCVCTSWLFLLFDLCMTCFILKPWGLMQEVFLQPMS